jgi:hypothetical protein
MQEIKKIFHSKNIRWAVGVLGVLLVATLIFHAGVVFGTRQALYSERFPRDPRHSFFPGALRLPPGYVPGGHGAVGVITEVALPTVTIQMRDGSTDVVTVGTSTIIESTDGQNTTSSLVVGRPVVIIGAPGTLGGIGAKVIRVIASSTKP